MTSREYFEFISDVLSPIDGVTFYPMMGEYVLKYRDKTVGGLYDDRLLIKITDESEKFFRFSPRAIPYQGAKEMIFPDGLPSPSDLKDLFEKMFAELPKPKRRKK
ncbi:MAG: hypothetical protein IJR61_04390 [Clostridia bacterium]|nr:hypothetical protein [Clostridia bacterium]